MAKRFVDACKRALKKLRNEEDIFEARQTYLWSYRSTPMKGRKTAPAEEMLGRKIRIQMDLTSPIQSLEKNNCEQRGGKLRPYKPNDEVYAKIHKGNGWTWAKGAVIERISRVMYNVL